METTNKENLTTLTDDENETKLQESPTIQSDAIMALATATSDLARAINTINYSPTTWVDNAPPDINAANLNKIEQGILQATNMINNTVSAINTLNGNISFNNSGVETAASNTGISENIYDKTTGEAIHFSYNKTNAEYRVAHKPEGGQWESPKILITNSDFSAKTCVVETIAGKWVAIPDAPTSRYGYIPVIDGHKKTNDAQETVFYDSSFWRIISNTSQITSVVFYKIPY